MSSSFKIAVIGQSAFSAEFLKLLVKKQYEIAAVFTIPDDPKTGREDILATTAKSLNITCHKVKRWRVPPETQKAIPEMLELYKSVNADLNVLPFCNQFIPMEIIEAPTYKSINYHPSLLPLHRGASAINWTLIEGDKEAGLTIFWTDDGLDTGPILMKRSCYIEPNDTVDSLYRRFLFPEGIKALVESVELVNTNQAPRITQPAEGASYEDKLMQSKVELTRLPVERADFDAKRMHNFIRGMDKVPGSWCNIKLKTIEENKSEKNIEFEKVRLFGSSIQSYSDDEAAMIESLRLVQIEGLERDGIIHQDGLLIFPNVSKNNTKLAVNVGKLQIISTGKTIRANSYGSPEADRPPLELTEDELRFKSLISDIWLSILPLDSISSGTDFFNSGAASMDVVRLVEEVKEIIGDSLELESEDVYMATQFEEFIQLVMRRYRGESARSIGPPDYLPTTIEANKMSINFPTQLFIDNKFCNSIQVNNTMDSINPSNEQFLCKIQMASYEDVDKAVQAARRAFKPSSEWRQMNARDRGKLLNKLADLMEEHKQELATLESLDSGAVYTLALKTHIGMSIDAFRYYAGCCDKIQGATIPINHARPNSNTTITRRVPIGVCGIITPWNYPLMMISWKSAACLAAGNTLVLKPPQACSLTALKWAELVAMAGFPAGVVNVLPGKGSVCGQAILEHKHIKKIGFTGSTETGKHVMQACAKTNVKKVSLELGGKSPLVIFADCDLQKAVKFGMSSVFFNKGENCIAAGRLFVEDSIHDEFIELVLEETKKMTIGDPLKRSTSHGPQNHLEHLQSLERFCQKAIDEGAKLIIGGKRLDCKGYFFYPTIFTDVEDHMFCAKEESFGPIMLVSRFDNGDFDGVLRRANATDYGLASAVFTNDLTKAMRFEELIEAGTCFVNCYNKTDVAAPFGGFKESGFGKDLGQDALNEYLQTKVGTYQY